MLGGVGNSSDEEDEAGVLPPVQPPVVPVAGGSDTKAPWTKIMDAEEYEEYKVQRSEVRVAKMHGDEEDGMA